MTKEEKARIEAIKNWAPQDLNYQFLIGLIEEQERIIQADNAILDDIAERAEAIIRMTED